MLELIPVPMKIVLLSCTSYDYPAISSSTFLSITLSIIFHNLCRFCADICVEALWRWNNVMFLEFFNLLQLKEATKYLKIIIKKLLLYMFCYCYTFWYNRRFACFKCENYVKFMKRLKVKKKKNTLIFVIYNFFYIVYKWTWWHNYMLPINIFYLVNWI